MASASRRTGVAATCAPLAPANAADGPDLVGAASPRPRANPGATPADVIMVGCSRARTRRHQVALAALEAAGEVVVRAVVDSAERARTEFCSRFPQAAAHDTLEAVAVPPNALAILAGSVHDHAEQATAAFKRGWHVLCEPPLALTAREATLMNATAHRHERLLAVGLLRRFFPAARYLHALCRDHLLGPPLSFRIREGRPEPSQPAPGAAGGSFEPPEGVLAELGVDVLDLLTWSLGRMSILRYADDAMGGVEANAFLELAFPERVHGTVHLSRDWPTPDVSSFVFERGIVLWHAGNPTRLTVQLANAPAALDAQMLEPITASQGDDEPRPLAGAEHCTIAQLRNVIAAIAGRTFLLVPATAAMTSTVAIEACYARRTLIEQPWLTHNEGVHARALALPPEGRRP